MDPLKNFFISEIVFGIVHNLIVPVFAHTYMYVYYQNSNTSTLYVNVLQEGFSH
jgi:hypothetical protein